MYSHQILLGWTAVKKFTVYQTNHSIEIYIGMKR